MYVDHVPLVTTPTMEITPALSAPIPNTVQPLAPVTDLCQILYKFITPCVLEAWRWALHDAGISQNYPNLMHDLKIGSPISNPPPIDFTFIPKNLTSTEINPDYITNLIAEEVSVGHMDGPYSIEEVHLIMAVISAHVHLVWWRNLVQLIFGWFSISQKKISLVCPQIVGWIQMISQQCGLPHVKLQNS